MRDKWVRAVPTVRCLLQSFGENEGLLLGYIHLGVAKRESEQMCSIVNSRNKPSRYELRSLAIVSD